MEEAKHQLTDLVDAETSAKKIKLDSSLNPQRKPEEPNTRPLGIQEEDVGITEYISKSNNGFSGILKQRYYDFLVNEIDMDGNVVHLTDEGFQNRKERRLEKKTIEKQYKAEDTVVETPEPVKEDKPIFQLKLEHRIALLELLGEEDLTKIEELLTTGNNIQTSKAFESKDQRGKIHQLLREAFEGKLESFTTDSNYLKIALSNKNSRTRRRNTKNGSKDDIESEYGLGPVKDYLRLTVYKENKETMEVASLLSKFLRIPTKWIGYAGTKDRRGVTVQRLSIGKMKVSRVNNLNKILRGVRIGSFSYSDEKLALGDLKGNEFIITVKDIQRYDTTRPLEDVLQESFGSLKDHGFINYFGMQRFGTFSISTHVVGIKLLHGKWKEAVELLLSEQELVTPESVEARKIWSETHDLQLTLEKMPRKCNAEFAILDALTREKLQGDDYNENSYFVAIMKIPRNLRIMYGHAYQSYVWNCAASKRLELFGLEIVEGDLVLVDDVDKDTASTGDLDDEDFEEDVRESKFIRARPVTMEEIISKKFTLYDVVLPTPGFDVLYPSNPALAKVYEDVMAKDGLDPNKMSRNVREFSLSGSYRKLMGQVTDLEYHIRHYNTNDQTLVKTDLDILKLNQQYQKEQIDKVLQRKEELTEDQITKEIDTIMNLKEFPKIEQIEDGDKGGDKTAVIIKMQLPVSAYATMLLRELMKKDTSRRGDVCDVLL